MNVDGGEAGTGVLNITADNEGLDTELHLTINGGTINITSGNDGINTNEDNVSVTTVNGGSVNIQVTGETGEGDGIDSNGSITMTGGTVFVSGPVSGSDGAIDFETDMTMTGGSILALSSRGMMEYPSTQHYYTTSIAANAGDFIAVCDADGNVLMGMQTQKRFPMSFIATRWTTAS